MPILVAVSADAARRPTSSKRLSWQVSSTQNSSPPKR